METIPKVFQKYIIENKLHIPYYDNAERISGRGLGESNFSLLLFFFRDSNDIKSKATTQNCSFLSITILVMALQNNNEELQNVY